MRFASPTSPSQSHSFKMFIVVTVESLLLSVALCSDSSYGCCHPENKRVSQTQLDENDPPPLVEERVRSMASLPFALPLAQQLEDPPPIALPFIPLAHPPSTYHSDAKELFTSLLRFIESMITPESCSIRIIHLMNFIIHSYEFEHFSTMDLCWSFPRNLRCNEYDHLLMIRIRNENLEGHLDLALIPNTVTAFLLPDNRLSSISGWSALEGKSVHILNVRHNRNLSLDLSGLVDNGMGQTRLSLRELVVTCSQIKKYFGLKGEIGADASYTIVSDWVKTSILDCLVIGSGGRHRRRPRRLFKFFKSGSMDCESQVIPARKRRSRSKCKVLAETKTCSVAEESLCSNNSE